MKNKTEQDLKIKLKIKLENHAQFLEAWDAFIKLGYHWDANCPKPKTAPYLYLHSDGRMLVDYFDVEGSDLSSTNSALGYFNAHDHKEITLSELKELNESKDAVFIGVDPKYMYYSVDADGEAYYTKTEPFISQRGDFWGKDISMRNAPNFKLHTDWKQSLIKRNKVMLSDLEVSTQ